MSEENRNAPAERAKKKTVAVSQRRVDALKRFFNIWLVTVAAFGAAGLCVGLLKVWPHDYLNRELPGVFLAALQAQISPALQNGFFAGFFIALLSGVSRRLGGRYRVRLVFVWILCLLVTIIVTYLRLRSVSQDGLFFARVVVRWGDPTRSLSSLVHLGMENMPLLFRATRIIFVGLIGLLGILPIHLLTRRRLRRDVPPASARPTWGSAATGFALTFAMLLTLGKSLTDVPAPGTPDIILISLDTLRADHLSCYGYERPTTPNLDEFARESIFVKNAISHAPWTLPSHASMFTGLLPYEHGAVEPTTPLDPKIGFFPETLKQEGFRTAAYVTGILLSEGFGFDRGFDIFSFRDGWDGAVVAAEALAWIGQRRQPSFLFLHLFDLHYPYHPPPITYTRFGPPTPFLMRGAGADFGAFIKWTEHNPRAAAKAAIDRYDEEILYVDRILGAFFNQLKLTRRYDNALIIVTSDHGEEFFDHGSWGHSQYLYDESLRVPLLIKLPGGAGEGLRVESGQVALKSLPQLILAVAAAPPFRNPALLPDEKGMPAAVRNIIDEKPILSETQFSWQPSMRGTHRFSARTQKYKVMEPYKPTNPLRFREARGWELYDLQADPGELESLDDLSAATDLADALKAAKAALEKRTAPALEHALDKATEQRLRSLGYLQ